ncbi:MAG TPA: hypothetical protein VGJ57_11085 [Nitrospirales bacterium]|jgi:hypothetical protein
MPDDFRITFFFGPDNVPERVDVLVCVFNVKKRSWKGGVQVGVELTREQLQRVQEAGQLDELIEMIRAKVEPEDFKGYERRARDLFVQQVCRAKLDLAIASGMSQENQTIAADALIKQLDREVPPRTDGIRQAILTELDL